MIAVTTGTKTVATSCELTSAACQRAAPSTDNERLELGVDVEMTRQEVAELGATGLAESG